MLDVNRFTRFPSITHVYSTALAGPMLYDRLRVACTRKLCMLDKMWMVKKGREHTVASVRIGASSAHNRSQSASGWTAQQSIWMQSAGTEVVRR